jgi:hypothetical protein
MTTSPDHRAAENRPGAVQVPDAQHHGLFLEPRFITEPPPPDDEDDPSLPAGVACPTSAAAPRSWTPRRN